MDKPTGIPGDFNNDGIVDWADMLQFIHSGTFGKMLGDEGYDPMYDLNGDDRIDIEDFDILQKMMARPGDAAPE